MAVSSGFFLCSGQPDVDFFIHVFLVVNNVFFLFIFGSNKNGPCDDVLS